MPVDAEVPTRKRRKKISPLLNILREQMHSKTKGGIYHKVQIDLTYNSNHIEGSRLTHDQTRYIFETNTIGITAESVNIDDIIGTTNHFRAIDFILEDTDSNLTETYIKRLHQILKTGTSDERKEWFRVGDYKRLPNEVGGKDTTPPENVHMEMKAMIQCYNKNKKHSLEDI